MIIEHKILKIFGKKVFELAVVSHPLKNFNPLPDEACFLYVIEGTNNSYSEEGHLALEAQDGVMMKCGNYMYQAVPDTKSHRTSLFAVHFYPDVMERIYENKIPQFFKTVNEVSFKKNMAPIRSSKLIVHYVENMLLYFEQSDKVREDLLILKFKEIVQLLLNTKDAGAVYEIMHNLFSPRSFTFKQVVESHIFSPLSISDLAELTFHSLSSFKREFRKLYNNSPANYIKKKRLERAVELLITTDERIMDIAHTCQFKDQAHFASSFKAKYQISPTDYRMSHRDK